MKKLPTESVYEILRLYQSGDGCDVISQKTGVRKASIRNILRGRTRTDITGGRVMHGRRPSEELNYFNPPMENQA